MKDLMALRDLLAGAKVPNGVLGVNCNFGQWEVHVREDDFRAAFGVFTHVYHAHYRGGSIYRIEFVSGNVKFYALTDEAPETDAQIIASERQDHFAQVREEVLSGDLVANARAWR